jgi:phospholipid/cholesterol/gamma-HCH transport system permease protein
MFSIGVFAVAMLAGLGGEARAGSIFLTAAIQDPARWITGMVVAGVAGSSMTADLGARKIREELDALQVLGVDIIRTLVLPRVIAMSVMFALMFIVSLLVSVAAVGTYVVATGKMELMVYAQSIFDTITAIQLLGGMGVVFLFGLMTGLVCSHKGLNAGGGPEGVGRAVNQAVVICFIGMFALNVVWNTITQAVFPQMNVAR